MLLNDRYETSALLGEGAFGRTFAARDTRTGAELVLKQISVRGLPGWKPFEYFEREAAVLRTLDHPGVPRFVDAFETETPESGPTLVLVMERIEGETLLALIQRGHRWQEDRARPLLERLLETLDHLHRLSPPVIHRDIKPANVMLRSDGSPVLVDFGAIHDWGSRVGHGSLTVVGTVGYMAPEQAMGAPVPASDLFALGATMVHALSHCHPVDLPRHGLQMAFEDRLGCSAQLIGILQRMVEPDVRARYTRASHVLADLRRPPDDRAPARSEPEPPRTRALIPLALPAAPRALTPVAHAHLRGRSTLRGLKALGGSAAAMAGTGIMLASSASVPSLLIVAALAAIGVTGALAVRRGNRRDRQLHRDGTAVQGRVIEVRRDRVGAMLYAKVLYAFQVGDTGYLGELDASAAAAREVEVDAPVLVIHDPEDPGRHFASLIG